MFYVIEKVLWLNLIFLLKIGGDFDCENFHNAFYLGQVLLILETVPCIFICILYMYVHPHGLKALFTGNILCITHFVSSWM